jgi:hypothetical protein
MSRKFRIFICHLHFAILSTMLRSKILSMIDDFGIFSPHFYFHFSASEVLWYSRHIFIYWKNILVDQCSDVHNLRSDIHDTWLLFLFNPRSSFRFTVQLKLFINLSIRISSRLPIIKYWFLLHKDVIFERCATGGLCFVVCSCITVMKGLEGT